MIIAWQILPALVTLAALLLGPTAIVARAYLRWIGGAHLVRQWYRPVAWGLGGGIMTAVTASAAMAQELAVDIALLSLLFLLASIDWRWRWLPIEWTVAVIALALIWGLQTDALTTVLVQMGLPALTLLAVRQVMIWRSGKEAMGLGDIWLIAGLGGFLLPTISFLLVGLAAVSGLIEAGLRRIFQQKQAQTFGVSYGTHLCIVFIIIRHLWQII